MYSVLTIFSILFCICRSITCMSVLNVQFYNKLQFYAHVQLTAITSTRQNAIASRCLAGENAALKAEMAALAAGA